MASEKPEAAGAAAEKPTEVAEEKVVEPTEEQKLEEELQALQAESSQLERKLKKHEHEREQLKSVVQQLKALHQKKVFTAAGIKATPTEGMDAPDTRGPVPVGSSYASGPSGQAGRGRGRGKGGDSHQATQHHAAQSGRGGAVRQRPQAAAPPAHAPNQNQAPNHGNATVAAASEKDVRADKVRAQLREAKTAEQLKAAMKEAAAQKMSHEMALAERKLARLQAA